MAPCEACFCKNVKLSISEGLLVTGVFEKVHTNS